MPATTSSAVLIAPHHIELQAFPVPHISDDDALVHIEGTGICGSDWAPYAGTWPTKLPPLILGHEVVGKIAAIGPSAAARWNVSEGDRVVVEESVPCGHCTLCRTGRQHMCDPLHTPGGLRYGLTPVEHAPHLWGGFGEYLYLHPRAVVHRISPSVAVEVAPLFIPISNGIRWVERDGGCRIGDTVVIIGPGQHGLGCVIGAKRAGAATIIVVGTSADAARLDVAKKFGATHVVNVDDGPSVEQICQLTSTQMADVVVDVTGGPPTALADSTDMARIGGTIIVAGFHEMRTAPNFYPDKLFMKELTLKGVYGHDWLSVKRAIALIESADEPLDAICTHTYPLDNVTAALEALGPEGNHDAIHITVVP